MIKVCLFFFNLPYICADKDKSLGWVEYAETVLYGDVVLRLVNSQNFSGKFLPNFADVAQREGQVKPFNYGLKKFDHIVGNLWTLQPTMDNIKKATVSDGNNTV